jgi:hypothetical protein
MLTLLIGMGLAFTSWNASAALTVHNELLSAGGTVTIGGATYTQVPPQSTGSGVIDSFVRISTNQDQVQGYNTTINNTFDNGSDNTHNYEITVGEVGFIGTTPGVMRFLLDINQTGDNPRISLNDLQIFISGTKNQGVETFIGSLVNLSDSTLVYQLDGSGDHQINLDFSLNSGSGSGDMFLDIPFAMFDAAFTARFGAGYTAAQANGAYIYLYSDFGVPGYPNNDGFEEWAHFNGNPVGETPCDPTKENCGPQIIPEPGALPLVGLALISLGIASRRRRL